MLKALFRIALILVFASAAGLCYLVWQVYQFSLSPLGHAQELVYIVKPGVSLQRIAMDLYRLKLIPRAKHLVLLAKWYKVDNKIKAGEYLISPSLTPVMLLEKMVKGDVVQYELTVVEGWRFTQLLEALAQQPHLNQTLTGLSTEEVMVRLGFAGQHPEGRFLPDTYKFPGGTTDVDFLRRAYKSMEQVLDREWQNRDPDLPYKTPYEALIMASIIEKETGQSSERQAIAGVFVRRLSKKMYLQSDPTIIYGMGDSYDGNIRRQDIKNDTPYNTYKHGGLTPTPIALPGLAAIQAALHPQGGNAIFFVARGDGSHVFAETLAEHNANVKKYQLKK